jgi:hypothetical protein
MKIYTITSPAVDWLCDSVFLPSIRRCEPEADVCVVRVPVNGNGDFGSDEFKRVQLLRLEKIPTWIEENNGNIILVSDIDIKYLRPFVTAMIQEMGDADLAFQRENVTINAGVNMGQMLIKCSSITLRFFKSVLEEHRLTGEWEQAVVNKFLLREWMANQLSCRLLSEKFANTNLGFLKEMYSFHPIGTFPSARATSLERKRQQFDDLEMYLGEAARV